MGFSGPKFENFIQIQTSFLWGVHTSITRGDVRKHTPKKTREGRKWRCFSKVDFLLLKYIGVVDTLQINHWFLGSWNKTLKILLKRVWMKRTEKNNNQHHSSLFVYVYIYNTYIYRYMQRSGTWFKKTMWKKDHKKFQTNYNTSNFKIRKQGKNWNILVWNVLFGELHHLGFVVVRPCVGLFALKFLPKTMKIWPIFG